MGAQVEEAATSPDGERILSAEHGRRIQKPEEIGRKQRALDRSCAGTRVFGTTSTCSGAMRRAGRATNGLELVAAGPASSRRATLRGVRVSACGGSRHDHRHLREGPRDPDRHGPYGPGPAAAAERGGRGRAAGGLRGGVDPRGRERIRPGVLRRPRSAAGLPRGDAAEVGGDPRAGQGWADTAEAPRANPGGGQPAGRPRRPSPRGQARPGTPRPLLRHALAGKCHRRGALSEEPVLRDPAAPLQPRRGAARARPRPLRERPPHRHVRAEEQPDEADGGGRRRAVQARSRPTREAVRAGALRCPLRRGRPRGPLLYVAEGEGVVVPPLQPRLERRGREPSEPERPEDRLPLEAGPHSGEPDGDPRELRAARRDEGRGDGAEEPQPGLAALPPARRRPEAPRRRPRSGHRTAVPRPALGGERQVELHRMARPPADRPAGVRRAGRRDRVRLGRGRHRSPDPRPADPRHDQVVRPGLRDDRPRGELVRPREVPRVGEEDRHLDGPDVPARPRQARLGAPGAGVRDRHRRGSLEPGRADVLGPQHGPRHGRREGRGGDDRGPDQPDHGGAEAPPERELLRLHGDAEEQDARDLRRAVCGRRRDEASPVPRLHDEAGDRGGLHPRRPQVVHAGRELLPPREDDPGGPRVRHEARTESSGGTWKGTSTPSA